MVIHGLPQLPCGNDPSLEALGSMLEPGTNGTNAARMTGASSSRFFPADRTKVAFKTWSADFQRIHTYQGHK